MSYCKITGWALVCWGLMFSCAQAPSYPITPVIEYLGVNKLAVLQEPLGNDTLEIYFSFTDGDGDISLEDSTDVFLFDSRIPTITNQYKIPTISEEGTSNGIRGEITIRIKNVNGGICCVENQFPCFGTPLNPVENFSYEIQIRDRAGNLSNRISTETIQVICQ
ncbi:hypothetical protein [Lewinella cohaerens]|uniref:hypothetical protein n=1 Tax=Lewinella cohaerens TaxID=70995 RepID=UPI0004754770|nr:hypothetical protein [Lewinella cohaerens]